MADCFYHGQSLPGLCPDCERARQLKLKPEQVESTIQPVPMDERYDRLGTMYLAQLQAAGRAGADRRRV